METAGTAEFAGISGLAVVQFHGITFFIYSCILTSSTYLYYLSPFVSTSTMFRPDSPIELPDGRLACGDHGLVICGICCVDYSFMGEDLADEDEWYGPDIGDGEASRPALIFNPNLLRDDGIDTQKLRAGTGRVLFTKFTPPNDTVSPSSLFTPGMAVKATPVTTRFINRSDPTQLLIYTDGACLDNGRANPRAGCAFVYRPSVPPVVVGYDSFRLETEGPTGEQHTQTSNRAELRAVIGALRFRHWKGEGFDSLVIATDSEYVVEGATNWVRGWLRRGWKTSVGAPVKNKDLWEALLGEAERWSDIGLDVKFWRIPRELNTLADQRAKEAATGDDVKDYSDRVGFFV